MYIESDNGLRMNVDFEFMGGLGGVVLKDLFGTFGGEAGEIIPLSILKSCRVLQSTDAEKECIKDAIASGAEYVFSRQ